MFSIIVLHNNPAPESISQLCSTIGDAHRQHGSSVNRGSQFPLHGRATGGQWSDAWDNELTSPHNSEAEYSRSFVSFEFKTNDVIRVDSLCSAHPPLVQPSPLPVRSHVSFALRCWRCCYMLIADQSCDKLVCLKMESLAYWQILRAFRAGSNKSRLCPELCPPGCLLLLQPRGFIDIQKFLQFHILCAVPVVVPSSSAVWHSAQEKLKSSLKSRTSHAPPSDGRSSKKP